MSGVLRFPTPASSNITVHEVAPSAPPIPPPDGAVVVLTKDANGRILSYGWVVGEMGRENVIARTFDLRRVIAPLLAGAS
jgi:hypothetical protein